MPGVGKSGEIMKERHKGKDNDHLLVSTAGKAEPLKLQRPATLSLVILKGFCFGAFYALTDRACWFVCDILRLIIVLQSVLGDSSRLFIPASSF